MGDQPDGEIESVPPVETSEPTAGTGSNEAPRESEENPSLNGGEPAPADPRPPLASVLEDFDARLAEAQRLLGRQSELTERLHAENTSLRAGELRSAQLPLVRDLMRLCDDVERMSAVAGESVGDLELVHASLLDILARNGIETFGAGPGEPFDARLHSAAGVDPTEDEQLDRTVAEVVRSGFRWDSGDVIRAAEVRAYRFGGSS
jgi:molecular chaperone GrpE